MPCSNISDVSFGGEQCGCRPSSEQSCSTCTRKENCVWLDDSDIEVTAILGVGNNAIVSTFSLNSGSSCWAGDMFYGPTWTDWILYGNIIIFFVVFVSAVTFCYCLKLAINKRKMRMELNSGDEPLVGITNPTGAVVYSQ